MWDRLESGIEPHYSTLLFHAYPSTSFRSALLVKLQVTEESVRQVSSIKKALSGDLGGLYIGPVLSRIIIRKTRHEIRDECHRSCSHMSTSQWDD